MKLKARPSNGKHKVKDGEWVGNVAWEYGFPVWEVVWNHPKNASLREKRPDPHVLDEGDELFIPEPKPLDSFLRTGESHVFRLPQRTQLFRLQLLDEHGDPMVEEPYKLTVKCTDDVKFEQKFEKTDSDGYVAEELPLTAESGELEMTGRDHKIELNFGKLTPIDLDDEDAKFLGTQQRLKALGFYDGEVDGKDSPRLKAGVKAFQRFCRVNLASNDPAILDPGPVDGIMGPKTRDALLRYYGS